MIDPSVSVYTQYFMPMDVLDDLLIDVSESNHLLIKKNVRQCPCRILRKLSNPEWIVEISVDQDWRQHAKESILTYSVHIAAILSLDDRRVCACKTITVMHQPLSYISDNLLSIISEALDMLYRWTSLILTAPSTLSDSNSYWFRPSYALENEYITASSIGD